MSDNCTCRCNNFSICTHGPQSGIIAPEQLTVDCSATTQHRTHDRVWIAQDGKPIDGQLKAHRVIRDRAESLLDALDELVPDGRHKALAKNKIEEAVVWAGYGLFNPHTE